MSLKNLLNPSTAIKNFFHSSTGIYLWFRRLLVYIILYFVVIIISYFSFNYFELFHVDTENNRYMLSALIQSEAAIIAIVITLSLISVQMAAQSYSTRVTDIFKNAPDLQIIISIYLGAIIYGLAVLKNIREVNQLNNITNYENYVLSAYALGIFVFIALIPYMWYTLNLLNPSSIVDIFSEKITKKNLISIHKRNNDKIADEDPIQPIVDILRGSLMKYDFETVRYGLAVIQNRMEDIFEKNDVNESEGENILPHIVSHLMRVGILAMNKDDDDSAIFVISILNKIGKIAVSEKFQSALEISVNSLLRLGTVAITNKNDGGAVQVVYSLNELGKVTAEENWDPALYIVDHLSDIGKLTAEQKLETTLKVIVASFKNIGLIAVDNKFENLATKVIESLRLIGIRTTEQKLYSTSENVVDLLDTIVIRSNKKGMKDVTINSINSIGDIAIIAAEKKMTSVVSNATIYLYEFGIGEVLNENYDVIQPSIELLGTICEVTIENKIEGLNENLIEYLHEIAIEVIKRENNNLSIVVVDSIVDIGITALKQRKKEEADLVYGYLSEIIQKINQRNFQDSEYMERLFNGFSIKYHKIIR